MLWRRTYFKGSLWRKSIQKPYKNMELENIKHAFCFKHKKRVSLYNFCTLADGKEAGFQIQPGVGSVSSSRRWPPPRRWFNNLVRCQFPDMAKSKTFRRKREGEEREKREREGLCPYMRLIYLFQLLIQYMYNGGLNAWSILVYQWAKGWCRDIKK